MQKKTTKQDRQNRDSGVSRHRRGPVADLQSALGPCHDVVRVIHVAMSALTPGTVVRARCPFTEGGGLYKPRPVVVVEVRGGVVIARPCTTSASRFRFADTVEVDELSAAGLFKPTGVLGRLVSIERRDVIGLLGHLSAMDYQRVFVPVVTNVGVAA